MTHSVVSLETIPGSARRFAILLTLVFAYIGAMLLLESRGLLTAKELDISLFLGCLMGCVVFILFLVADLLEGWHVFFGVTGCVLIALYMLLELFDVLPWQ